MKFYLVLFSIIATCIFVDTNDQILRKRRETEDMEESCGPVPGDPNLCEQITLAENGTELIPGWMAICDQKDSKTGRVTRFCIFDNWICDCQIDCCDGSDEYGCKNCPNEKGKYRKGQYMEEKDYDYTTAEAGTTEAGATESPE